MQRDFLQGCVVTRKVRMAVHIESRFELDTRRKFFPVKVMRHWHRKPWKPVSPPSVEVLKAGLDGTPSNLAYLKVSLLIARGF